MAEETPDSEEEVAEPPKAKLGMVQILMIIAIVIVTQVVMKVVLDTFYPTPVAGVEEEAEEAEDEEEEIPPEERGPANYLPLDPALVVNIRHDGESQYLQASVQLMTWDTDVYDAAKTHAPALRSALIMLFSTADYEALGTVEGKRALQEAARDTINRVLKELAGIEGVDAVYLTSLVFQ